MKKDRIFIWVCIAGGIIVFIAVYLFMNPNEQDEQTLEPENIIYKKVDSVALDLDVYRPAGHVSSDRSPAIVLFFGGGWLTGNKAHFAPHARYFSSRGMVAITVNYRTIKKHNTTVFECVKDTRSAMRWVRKHSAELGIDPDRIVAGGGSAGGHLALCTTLLDGPDNDDDDITISSHANAFVLFNPVVNTSVERMLPRYKMGSTSILISPQHHIRSNLPPGILFHGRDDKTVPFETVDQFTKDMNTAGNDLRLVAYEGQIHGFFNEGRNDNVYYRDTVRKADLFLIELGYLKGKPTIDDDKNPQGVTP